MVRVKSTMFKMSPMKEWLNSDLMLKIFSVDPEAYEWINSQERDYQIPNIWGYNIGNGDVGSLFLWSDTPQNTEYWSEIRRSIVQGCF